MMYQRDMGLLPLRVRLRAPSVSLAEEAQQELDDGVEQGIDAEEENGEHGGHDHDHDGRGDGFLAARPDDLAGLCADLTDVFAGGGFRHFLSLLDLQIEKGSAGTLWIWAAGGADSHLDLPARVFKVGRHGRGFHNTDPCFARSA